MIRQETYKYRHPWLTRLVHDKQKRQHQAAHDADFHVPEDGTEERQGHERKVDPRLHPVPNVLNKVRR